MACPEEKYFSKHHMITDVKEYLKQEILRQAVENQISCAAAEKISQTTKVPLSEIGLAVDMLNIKIIHCQLGLFGYEEKKKLLPVMEEVSNELRLCLEAKLVGGKLPCFAAWEIASLLNMRRLDVGASCEKLKIKIKPCQLGAF